MKYQVYRMFENGADFCFDFETIENAQNYVKNKKRQNPSAIYQIFENFYQSVCDDSVNGSSRGSTPLHGAIIYSLKFLDYGLFKISAD